MQILSFPQFYQMLSTEVMRHYPLSELEILC